jgi:4a-hydroxytetrahydrobiopterin dehydratase
MPTRDSAAARTVGMARLSDDEIRDALGGLPGWELVDGALTKQYGLGGFPAAVAFVVRLSYPAEAANHHPDLDIRYSRVRVTLSTHDEGGVTAKDLDLARAIEDLAPG